MVLLVSLTLAACGSGKMADLEEYVAEVKARDPGPIEPLPEIEQIDTFVFEPGDRRDPFVLDTQTVELAAVDASGGIAPDPLRRKEELEQYSLDSLKMMGTLEQDGTIWGLVKTPEGTLHRVRSGNYLGQNNGQITRITEDAIELTEIVSDGAAEWRERPAAIALSQ
jgi:type IV pilus assembly protein PilP